MGPYSRHSSAPLDPAGMGGHEKWEQTKTGAGMQERVSDRDKRDEETDKDLKSFSKVLNSGEMARKLIAVII